MPVDTNIFVSTLAVPGGEDRAAIPGAA